MGVILSKNKKRQPQSFQVMDYFSRVKWLTVVISRFLLTSVSPSSLVFPAKLTSTSIRKSRSTYPCLEWRITLFLVPYTPPRYSEKERKMEDNANVYAYSSSFSLDIVYVSAKAQEKQKVLFCLCSRALKLVL